MKNHKILFVGCIIIFCLIGFVIVLSTLNRSVDKPTFVIPTAPFLTSWSKNSSKLLIVDKNDSIEVWSFSLEGIGTREISFRARSNGVGIHAVSAITFNHDGTSAIIGYQDGTVIIWDTIPNKIRFQIQAHPGWVSQVTWSPDEKKITSSSIDGTKIWDTNKGIELFKLKENIPYIIWTTDSNKLIGQDANATGNIIIWSAQDGHEVTRINTGDKLALSPNGVYLFTSFSGIWNLWTGRFDVSHCTDCYGTASAFAWSHDSKRVAVGSGASMCFEGSLYCVKDFDIRVWKTIDDPAVIKLSGHTNDVIAVGWSIDNTEIYSVSLDETMRMWDATTYKLLTTIHVGNIRNYDGAKFSPNGELLSVEKDDAVDIWAL